MSIRDHWDKPEAPAPAAIKRVRDTLGIDVHCQPEWTILVAELDKIYEDNAQLIAFVVGSLRVWFETLAELLDDANHETWSEKLLSRIYEVSPDLKVAVEVLCRRCQWI